MGHAQQAPQVLHNHVRPAVTLGKAPFVKAMPTDQRLNLSIVLPLRNQSELTSLLGRLYDPTSPDYRHFLSVTQFTEQFGPTAQDYQAVVAFARSNGFTITGPAANRLVVPISGTVAQINHAFNVTMGIYQHPTENRTFYSPDREPSLALSVPVAHIAGLNNYSIPHPMLAQPPLGQVIANVTGSGPGGSYLASDMRAAYYGGTTLDGNGQAVGLVEFDGYNLPDVDETFSNAGQAYSVPINNVLLDGATGAPSSNDAEEVLDIVQAIGMAPGLSQVRVYIGNSDADILNSMASENIAKQLSCSWSWTPDDPATADVFFQEFAAQGQSFFAASGDSGAFDSTISPYFYPQEDVYVTAVGGTHLTTNGAAGSWASEAAWNSYSSGSGGGISPDGISIPSWQAGVASTANGGSTTLRNVPDVAMEGDFDNYSCAMGSCYQTYAGTSFAAPRWAGFMALVNQQAVEAGTAPSGGLGFINPSIYAIGAGSTYSNDFHDPAQGNNDTNGQAVWFNAVTGYDLVTGWGSANGQSLIDELAGPQVPGFWILSSSSTVSINQGDSSTTTINVTDAGGFAGNVTLALTSTLPSGVTASWSTNPTSGSSVLTLTASSSAPAGNTTLTITGTSGSLTATTNITVAVHSPTFALSAAPSSLSVNQGGSTTTTIGVTPEYGFTGDVNLAVTGLPSGVTASWSANPTTGNSVLTLAASSSTAAGTYNLTVTGTSGAITQSISLALTVHAPSFTLITGGTVDIGLGSSGSTYIYVNPQYGFTGSVNLSVTGLPSGVTASFSPNPTTGNSALTLTASSTATVGTATLTVTGTSGSLTATATITLGVHTPSFTLSGPGTVNIGQGASTTAYVNVSPQYGFTGSVNLAISGLPSGVTALWNPNPTSSNSTLTLTASSSAPAGQYTVTITGTSGSLSATTTFTLGVHVPTFTLSSSGNVNVGQGTSATSYVWVYPQYGFTGSVNLSVSGLPSGVTASFSPNPTTGNSTLTLTASSTATLGQYTATITGTSGSQTATTNLTVGVYVPTFTLGSTGILTIGQGTSATTWVNVYPQYGFTGNVSLSVSGLPSGVTASFSPNPTTSNSTLTLTASSTAALGQYTVTITGTSGSQTATTTLTLGVYVPTFTLYSSGSVTIGQGTSSTSWVTISPQYGFAGNVSLSVSGLPSGVTASFSPNPATSTSTLTLTASSTAALGQYTVTITGTSGSQTATTNLTVGVYVPTFTLGGPGGVSVGQGTSSTGYVFVNPQYGFNSNVNLSISGLPSGVTASFSPNPATSTSALTLTASSSAVIGQYPVTITGTSGAQTASVSFTLGIYAQSFALYTSPNSLTMNVGASAVSYLSIAPQYGFSGNVNLSVSGLPSGVTASFSPNPTTNTSTLTLTASSSATPGTAALTITGTSGSLSASTAITLTINAPGFTLLSAPNQIDLVPGSSANSTMTVVPQNGFSGSVSLAVTGLPSGVTASISPNPAITNGTLTLTASSSATPGTSTITVTGTSGTLVATSQLALTVRTASAATSTTLTLTSAGSPVTTVASGTPVALTAAVTAGSTALTTGQVIFCDATAALCNQNNSLGTAQLTSAETAILRLIPGMGTHSYKAVFAGTSSNATSSSSPASLSVTATVPTTSTIAQSGNAGNYTLTGTVTGQGRLSPSGTVSFIDTSNANSVLGSADLAPTAATLAFVNSQTPATGTYPWGITTADFNGDGIPDLAAINSGNNTLSIYLGKGDGTFTTVGSNPPTGSYPFFVTTGDFNRDGKADLAVANANSNSLTILLGNGDGTFTASASSPQTGTSPQSIAVGDFNGDGVEDLAVANSASNTVTVLLGNGDGTFTPAAAAPQAGNDPIMIVTADFNGDGIEDLALSNYYASTITVLLGNGDGTFAPTASPSAGGYPQGMAVGDFNADGIADLAVVNVAGNTVTILLGNGDGTFSASASSSQTGNRPLFVAIGDFNGDGRQDLAITNEYSSTVTVLLGNGDGTFTAGATPSTGLDPASIAVADFNGDGIPDVATANYLGNTASVLTTQLTQTATATASAISPAGSGSHNVEAKYAGDTGYQSSVSATTALTAQPVAPAVTVTPSASSITTMQGLTVTVSVSGGSGNPTPTGNVTLTSGSYTRQQTLASGSTTFNIPVGTLPAGSDTLTATYAPDTAGSTYYIPSTQSATVTVTQSIGTVVPTVTATPSAHTITDQQSVKVTVSVTGAGGQPAPTGTVVLSSGGFSAQQTLSSGSLTFTVPAGTLTSGANTLTAAYSGDATYAATNATTTVTVAPFALSVSGLQSVSPGASATATATLAAGSTYSGTMNLSCTLTTSPQGAQSVPTCGTNPTSITLASGGSGTSVVTVNTTAASTAFLLRPDRRSLWGLGCGGSMLAFALMWGIPSKRRRWMSMLALLFILVVGAGIGCGGGGSSSSSPAPPSTPATTAGTYTFTLKATDAANANTTVSTTFSVMVQ